MRKFAGIALLATACLAPFAPAVPGAFAQEAHERHIIRGFAGYFTPSGDNSLNLSSIEYDNTAGFGIGYEFKATKWIGIPIEYSRYGSDIRFENVGKTSGDFDPITLGLMFHIVHARVVDLYLGPEAAYITYGKADFNVPGIGNVRVDVDNETTWGAKAGLDIKVFKWFGIGASVEYLDASANFESSQGSGSLDPKPVVSHLGVSFRF